MTIEREKELLVLALERELAKELLKLYKNSIKDIKKLLIKLEEKGFLNQTEIYRYNRLVSLHNNISKISNDLVKTSGKVITNNLIKEYTVSSEFEQYLIESSVGKSLSFSMVSAAQIKAALVNTLDPSTYLLRNKTNLIGITQRLNLVLAQGIVQGLSYREIAKKVDEVFNVGYKRALTLARTEAHRIRETASFEKAMEAASIGIPVEKMWSANFDEKTREAHGEADGQIVPIDEPFIVNGERLMFPGDPSGSAANVINCRCYRRTVVNNIMPDTIRIKGEGLVEYKTFKEWKNSKKN